MDITLKNIDQGKSFDWGRTSEDYARFRDIYPQEFYRKIIERNLCINGQNILDLGTGTGVLPRNMYRYGGNWVGTDISKEQIEQAVKLSEGMDITYYATAAEDVHFPDNCFDVVTACQCIWYFNHEKLMPELHRMLKPGGRLLILYMGWLPFEDEIAGASEELVLKYNPGWNGAGDTKHPVYVPECAYKYFDIVDHEEYDIQVPFTRETWHGRMKACRGVGASLSPDEIASWETEHKKLLNEIAPECFEIKHYGAIAELKVKKKC